MTKKRIGIIGYGARGKAYARVIEAMGDVEVSATSGPVGVGDHYMHFEDAGGLVGRGDLDGVIIAGATTQTADALALAVKRGAPALIVGSPGATPAQAAAVRDVAMSASADAPLFIASPFFTHGSVMRALDHVQNGGIGRILHIRAVYGHSGLEEDEDLVWRGDPILSGGGVLLHEGYELVRLAEAFGGVSIEATGMTAETGVFGASVAEDNAFGVLRLEGGAVAQLHVSRTQWRHTFRVEVTGEAGYVWLDGLLPKEEGFAPEMLISAKLRSDGDGRPAPNPAEEVRAFEDPGALQRTISSFISVIEGEPTPVYATVEAAQSALSAVHQIYVSAGYSAED